MKPNSKFSLLALASAVIIAFSASAHAQILVDPEFSYSFVTASGDLVTGDLFETGGTVTELTVNPFLFTNGTQAITVPALTYTTNGGPNEGTLALGASKVTVTNGAITAYNVAGTTYTPTGSSASFSIGLSKGATDFSASYPYGTSFAAANPTFQAVPEPTTWALMLGGVAFLFRRFRKFQS